MPWGVSSPSPSAAAVPEDLQFALEALHNLSTHCPDWARRLDELSGQIDQRQLDLAQCAEQQSSLGGGRTPGSKKSLRNRGSTESLRPKDDDETPPGTDDDRRTLPAEADAVQHVNGKERTSVLADGILPAQKDPSSNNEADSPSSSAAEQRTPRVSAVAPVNARAALRRTQLTRKRAAAVVESLLTGDGAAATKYRSKNLIIVYYDSYVQSFFEEVVKFVSASRNLMRKAKMAAKVAQIKRMAELEMPDDEESSGSEGGMVPGSRNGTVTLVPPQLSPSAPRPDRSIDSSAGTNGAKKLNGVTDAKGFHPPVSNASPQNSSSNELIAPTSPNHTLSYLRAAGNSTGIASGQDLSIPRTPFRAWSPYGGTGADPQQPPDVFDELDKGLEFVQSMCEHAAHQFLRDGDCTDEIVKIQARLTETRTSADAELERRLADDADGSLRRLMVQGPSKGQGNYRPHSMGVAAARLKTSFSGGKTNGFDGVNGVAGVDPAAAGGGLLEVDDGVISGLQVEKESPTSQYKSTGLMGPEATTGP